MSNSTVWAVTASNRKVIAECHATLEENFEKIAKMLDDYDFPVEFFHSSGRSRVFRDRQDLRAFIDSLKASLAA